MSDEFYTEFAGRGGDGDRHLAWSWANEDRSDKPVGTVFSGTITDRFKFKDKKEINRIAYVCETKDGPMVLFVSQWRLEKELARIAPKVGDGLKIRYDGIDSEDHQSKTFSVKVEPGAQVDEFYEEARAVPEVRTVPIDEDYSSDPF